MDVKAYIESGILEAYVLGALSQQEELQVRAMIDSFPELSTELRAIEEAMWQHAQSQAVIPPSGLQDKIWSSINGAPDTVPAQRQSISIPLRPERRSSRGWTYALAACLAASIVVNVFLWLKSADNSQSVAALKNQVDHLQADHDQLTSSLSEYQSANSMMADTGMQTIVMHTVQPGHPMAATLYWSKTKGEAFVAMNALPVPPAGMQYQLWVIQAGKPVSMGTLPNAMANTPGMQKVAMPVSNGEAFAISLEKEGGNPTPTTVYVLGRA